MGRFESFGRVTEGFGHPWDDGDPRGRHSPSSLSLVSHSRDGLGGGADEDEARVFDRTGEICPLGQEPIPWVDGLRSDPQSQLDQSVSAEVTLRRGRWANEVRFICLEHVRCATISLGVHRNRTDRALASAANNPDGDLPTIGDEDRTYQVTVGSGEPKP